MIIYGTEILLFFGDGAGGFTQDTASALVQPPFSTVMSLAFIDFDNDGDLVRHDLGTSAPSICVAVHMRT